MKVGLVGYAGSGKSTVFRWLTGVAPDPAKVQQGQTGMAKVPDARLDKLSAKFKPKKTTYAEIAFLDTPGLLQGERKDNPRRLGILREANGIVIVLDGFSGADPVAQLQAFREELLFADLEIVSNRIPRIEANLKKPRPAKERDADQAELELLMRVVAAFEAGQPAAELGLHPDEDKLVRSFQLLTLKPELVFLNTGDPGQRVLPVLQTLAPTVLAAPAQLELELEDLPAEDRSAFMADLGVTESQRGDTLRAIFAAMGRIAFLTYGEDECRAWPLTQGADAVAAAAAVHTDLAKGFIRAEVVHYDEFERVGFSEKEAKAHGLYRLEGKTYVVQDGDCIHIRANA
jgi:ribosome-binding ATPase